MGLALLDVADAIRPHPDVVAFLQHVEDDDFLDELAELDGWAGSARRHPGWLDRYGMRCVGEIDITRPRWSERPTTLLPMILSHIKNFEPGAGERRFEQGRQEALEKEQELLERLRALPDGEQKAEETKQMIDRVRTFIGYREYPKYGMVSRYFVYKQALLGEAERLVRGPTCFASAKTSSTSRSRSSTTSCARTRWTTSSSASARTRSGRIRRSRRPACSRRTARPSPGRTDATMCRPARWSAWRFPPGPSRGGPASSWTWRRPISKPGDILVTAYTDPSWTPLFVAIAGLVTEVGGLMTHGAVIAREYGLPAVVGVENATRLIPDGQRIRVHGTDGYVGIPALAGGGSDPRPFGSRRAYGATAKSRIAMRTSSSRASRSGSMPIAVGTPSRSSQANSILPARRVALRIGEQRVHGRREAGEAVQAEILASLGGRYELAARDGHLDRSAGQAAHAAIDDGHRVVTDPEALPGRSVELEFADFRRIGWGDIRRIGGRHGMFGCNASGGTAVGIGFGTTPHATATMQARVSNADRVARTAEAHQWVAVDEVFLGCAGDGSLTLGQWVGACRRGRPAMSCRGYTPGVLTEGLTNEPRKEHNTALPGLSRLDRPTGVFGTRRVARHEI